MEQDATGDTIGSIQKDDPTQRMHVPCRKNGKAINSKNVR